MNDSNLGTKSLKSSQNPPSKSFWGGPLGYGQNAVIIGSLWLVGWLLEYLTGGYGVRIPPFPYNAIALILYTLALFWVGLSKRGSLIVDWFMSGPLALTIMIAIALLTIIGGVLPQGGEQYPPLIAKLGLDHTFSGWPFALTLILLLNSLFLSALRRMQRSDFSEIGFVLNHFGLWIIFVAGLLGTGDLLRLKMPLYQGQLNWQALDSQSRHYEMPFALKLDEFILEEYPPRLAILDPNSKQILRKGPKPLTLKPQAQFKIEPYIIQVTDFFPHAMKEGAHFHPVRHPGDAPVAYLKTTHQESGATQEGWVTSGSMLVAPQFLKLPELALAMAMPRPKSFTSKLTVYTAQGEKGRIELQVNKPVSLMGWKLYQSGYDEKMGRWSNLSILELVRDPWLPFVYLGIVMLALGSLHMLWNARKQTLVHA